MLEGGCDDGGGGDSDGGSADDDNDRDVNITRMPEHTAVTH